MLCPAGTLKQMGGLFGPWSPSPRALAVVFGFAQVASKTTLIPLSLQIQSSNEDAEPVLGRHGLVSVQAESSLVTLKQLLPSHFSTAVRAPALGLC